MGKYLTKSKFTLSLDCPTKLYYANNKEYRSTMDDNDFLQALAKGGIQFDDLDETERQAIFQSLYQYCELDTLEMVMIHQHWEWLSESDL